MKIDQVILKGMSTTILEINFRTFPSIFFKFFVNELISVAVEPDIYKYPINYENLS